MALDNKLIPSKLKEQLLALGFAEEEIDQELILNAVLYQKALKGNVSAITKIKESLESNEADEEKAKDISNEVEKEEQRIINDLSSLSEEQKRLNKDLIHNIAFMSITLENLSKEIAMHGVKEKYKNGANQWGWKDRTEVKTYNNMFKNYQSALKQLNDLVKENSAYNIDDSFDNDDDLE